MKKLIFHLCVLGVLGGQIQAAAVDAEGRAAGDLPNAREIALADALREAVRQGTGVEGVVKITKTVAIYCGFIPQSDSFLTSGM